MRVTPAAYKLELSMMNQKMCFGIIMRYERNILIFSTIFRKNTRNTLFPQCKTSIGNNSGSVEDRAVKHGVFGNGGSNGLTAIFVT